MAVAKQAAGRGSGTMICKVLAHVRMEFAKDFRFCLTHQLRTGAAVSPTPSFVDFQPRPL